MFFRHRATEPQDAGDNANESEDLMDAREMQRKSETDGERERGREAERNGDIDRDR